jgi:hypothetical protein
MERMKNGDENGSENAVGISIQKQIIDKTVGRLSDNSLFTEDMLNCLKSESLADPWCSLDQLEKIVNLVETEEGECE